MNFESTVLFISQAIKDQVLANPRILNTITKLIWGNSKSADLKKKRTTAARVFTLKINDSDRALVNFEMIDGHCYIQVLDIILEHNYRDSLLNHPKELKKCIKDLSQRSLKDSIKHDFQASELQASESNSVQLDEALFYNHQWIVLNDRQNQVQNAPMPLIISGAPGSGKTCIALSLLLSAAEQMPDDNATRKVIYITSAEGLVNQLKDAWQANYATKIKGFEVDFITYDQLILKLDPSLKDKEKVSEASFNDWFKSCYKQQQKHKVRVAADAGLEISKEQEALLYQELRILCAYSKEKYLDLGQKQSFFNREVKAEMYEIFKSYMAYLEAKDYYDPALLEMNLSKIYDMVISDETQDFSNRQLKELMELAGHQFCTLFDSNQSLFDSQSILNYLKGELYAKQIPYSNIDFSETHRCPENIAGFANIILEIKKALAGRSDKQEAEEIFSSLKNGEAGQVVWLDKIKDHQKDYLKQLATGTTLAVVSLAEFIDEAREIYGTELVFTPEQIKGQQFNTVVAHRPFEDTGLIEASQLLKTKREKDTPNLRPAFNRIFTSITRSQKEFYVVQKTFHQASLLINLIKDKLEERNLLSSSVTLPKVNQVAAEKENWREQFYRQIQHKNLVQAQRILEKNLNSDPELFEILKREQQQDFENDQAVSNLKPDDSKLNTLQQSVGSSASKPSKDTATQTAGNQNKVETQRETSKSVLQRPNNIFNQLEKNCTPKLLKKIFNHTHLIEAFFTPYPNMSKKTVHYSLFYFLVKSDSYSVFYHFLEQNPQYCKQITGPLLEKKAFIEKIENGKIYSNFYLLTNIKISLFKLIIDNNPALLKAVTKDVLFKVNEKTPFSGFLSLVSNNDGNYCLKKIFRVHREFYEEIDEAILFTQQDLPKDFTIRQGSAFSPFLISFPSGLDLLLYLLNLKPQLLQKFKFQHLYLPYRDITLKTLFLNPFHHLSQTQTGVKILNIILKANPELIIPKYMGFMFNSYNDSPSTILNLLGFPEGIKLVRYILNKYPEELYDKLNIEEFFKLYDQKQRSSSNQAGSYNALCQLCSLKGGVSLLRDFLKNKPELYEKMNYESLFCSDTAYIDINNKCIGNNFTDIMISLAEDGLSILIDFIKRNPSIAKKISPDFLNWSIHCQEEINEQTLEENKIKNMLEKEEYSLLKNILAKFNPSLFDDNQAPQRRILKAPRMFRPASVPDATSEPETELKREFN